jgi:hypothetical protein
MPNIREYQLSGKKKTPEGRLKVRDYKIHIFDKQKNISGNLNRRARIQIFLDNKKKRLSFDNLAIKKQPF